MCLAGVSLITQVFYIVVFLARYTDLFKETHPWNYFFKIFYFLSSFYTVAIMRWVYPRTRERETAWKMGAAVLAGSLVLAPFTMMIFEPSWDFWWVSCLKLPCLLFFCSCLYLDSTFIALF